MSLAIPLVLTLLAQTPGAASPPVRSTESLAVLPIVAAGPHGQASMSAIYDAISRSTETRLGLRVISAEEMFVASRDGLAQRVADCGTDASCIASKLRMFNARFGLVVVLSFELDPPIYSLQLLDTDLGRKIGERVGDIPKGSSTMQVVTEQADALLESAGFSRSGRVTIEVEPRRAQLQLTQGGEPDLGTANVFTLAPGRYTVEAHLEGYKPATVEFEVGPGSTQSHTLSLQEDSSVWASPWLWVVVGVVAVGAGATAVAVSQRPDPCVCTTLNGLGCGCR